MKGFLNGYYEQEELLQHEKPTDLTEIFNTFAFLLK